MKDIKILGVVGMSGSGKSLLVNYLAEKGVPKVYFGGFIYQEMEKRGVERTVDGKSERHFREMIRESEGKDFVVRKAVESVKGLIAAGQRRIVLDGVYSWTEYKILKSEFPGLLTVVAVVVPKKLRFKRLGQRPERALTVQEAQDRDWTEIENLEKGGPIAMADYYVLNEGKVGEMYEKFEQILKEIEF